MIDVTFNTEAFDQEVENFLHRFEQASHRSLRAAAQAMVEKIVEKTEGPPPPPLPIKYYKRTNRMVSGWDPAARYLGIEGVPAPIGVKGREGQYIETQTASESSFIAINNTPYVGFVELTGTWKTPWPSRRDPYLIVFSTQKELQEQFPEFLFREWEKL
jgi:hypothetical protein